MPYTGVRWLSGAAVLFCAAVSSAAVLTVPAGGDLQAALNQAQPGDTVVVTAGATYTGSFFLPAKTGSSPITLVSSRASELPSGGRRVTPAHAPLMATLRATAAVPTLWTAAAARNWVVRGLEIAPGAGVYAYDVVSLGSSTPADATSLPENVVIDQCYIHGDPSVGSKRGVALNGRNLTLSNSHVSGIWSTTQESQAIAGWYGPGPFTVSNNYLSAAGVNLMFGGAAPSIAGLVPSDIRISGNHLFKPLEWKGKGYVIKNLLELKNAQRVEIRGNLLENSWPASQNGFGVLFTVRTCEAGDYSWAVVKDVVFEQNVLRNSTHGINVLGTDNVRTGCPAPSVAGKTSAISVRNNLFDNIGLPDSGIFLQLLSGVEGIVVDHNTVLEGYLISYSEGAPTTGYVFRNNIVQRGHYGVAGYNYGEGLSVLNQYMPGWIYERNLMIGYTAATGVSYPANNFGVADISGVGFTDPAAGKYELLSTSPYIAAATDGKPLGADIAAVTAASATAASGVPATPVTTPAPSWTVAAIYSGGSVIMQWTATPASSVADRICLFSASGGSELWCANATGAASGSVTVPLALPAGDYQARYILGNGTTAAVSATVTVPPPAVVTPTVEAVVGTGTLTVRWTAPAGSPATDAVELITAQATIWSAQTGGAASGSITLPPTILAGQYRFRYVRQGAAAPLALSPVFVLDPPPPAPGVYTVKTTVDLSGQIWLTWTAPAGRPSNDWVGLVAPGVSGYIWRFLTGGAQSGRVAVAGNIAPGRYFSVYELNGIWIEGARGNYIEHAPFVQPYSLSVALHADKRVRIDWRAPAGRPTNDWIGLRPAGLDILDRWYTNGATTGRVTSRVLRKGTYEIFYFTGGTWYSAVSAVITVP